MKIKFLLKGLLLSLTLLCSAHTWAYDFAVENDDGVTIYYNVITNNTCEVTYKSSSSKSYSGNVVIPANVTYNGVTFDVIGIGNEAFWNCSSLTEIIIPNSVTSIGSLAFKASHSLVNVTVGNSVVNIGEEAFAYCYKLEKVNLPSSLTSIETRTFVECTSLTEVTIGNSVTSIGDSAFEYCSSLEEVVIPSSVTSIGRYAFYECTSLKSITIPNGVTEIKNCTFSKCTFLSEVSIPNFVTSIGQSAFCRCKCLEKINLPNSLTSIEDSAFEGCSSLAEVVIPNSVTSIGSDAFSGCSNLTEIIIGESVTGIGNYAFADCSNLSEVLSLNPEPPTCDSYTFDSVDTSTCVLYVPKESIDIYSNTVIWKNFYNIKDIETSRIEGVLVDDAEVVGYYTIGGKAVDAPQRGINIIRYSDGSTRKILVQ